MQQQIIFYKQQPVPLKISKDKWRVVSLTPASPPIQLNAILTLPPPIPFEKITNTQGISFKLVKRKSNPRPFRLWWDNAVTRLVRWLPHVTHRQTPGDARTHKSGTTSKFQSGPGARRNTRHSICPPNRGRRRYDNGPPARTPKEKRTQGTTVEKKKNRSRDNRRPPSPRPGNVSRSILDANNPTRSQCHRSPSGPRDGIVPVLRLKMEDTI